MTTLAVLHREWKRFFTVRRMVLMGVVLLISWGAVEMGISQYHSHLKKAESFQKIEKVSYGHLKNYTQVSIQGIRILSLPSRLCFTAMGSRVLPEMSGRINTLSTLDVSENLRSPALFHSMFSDFTGFSGLFLVFVNLLVVGFGYETFQDTDYLRCLTSLFSSTKLFFAVITTRIFLLTSSLLFLYGTCTVILQLEMNTFSSIDAWAFGSHFIANLLMLLFFFLMGIISRLVFRRPSAGMTAAVAGLLVMVFLITSPLHWWILKSAETIPTDYLTELQKVKLLTEFEENAEKENGKFDKQNLAEGRRIIEGLWSGENLQLLELEETIETEFAKLTSIYNELALWTPTSFFILTANENAGGGYGEFLNFYRYVKMTKQRFLRFWIDEVYYKEPQTVTPFIQGNENVFYAKSHIPKSFFKGVMVNLGYLAVLLTISLFLLNRRLYHALEVSPKGQKSLSIDLNRPTLSPWLVREGFLKDILFILLSVKRKQLKKRGFDGNLSIDGEEISASSDNIPFIFLCHPDRLPGGLKVKTFMTTFGRQIGFSKKELQLLAASDDIRPIRNYKIKRLDAIQKFNILLSFLKFKKADIYLIDDISLGLPTDYYVSLLSAMEALVNKGALVIYLAVPVMIDINLHRMRTYYEEGSSLIHYLKSMQQVKRFSSSPSEPIKENESI